MAKNELNDIKNATQSTANIISKKMRSSYFLILTRLAQYRLLNPTTTQPSLTAAMDASGNASTPQSAPLSKKANFYRWTAGDQNLAIKEQLILNDAQWRYLERRANQATQGIFVLGNQRNTQSFQALYSPRGQSLQAEIAQKRAEREELVKKANELINEQFTLTSEIAAQLESTDPKVKMLAKSRIAALNMQADNLVKELDVQKNNLRPVMERAEKLAMEVDNTVKNAGLQVTPAMERPTQAQEKTPESTPGTSERPT